MARKQGGVNKFLNFIGLVDEEEPRRGAQLDYEDSYGRPSTYVPQQQRSRTEDTRRRTIVKDERARYGSESRYGSARTSAPARRTGGYADAARSGGYDYTPRTTSSRFGSYEAPPPRRSRAPSASAR